MDSSMRHSSAECFEDGVVRLAGAVVLYAIATSTSRVAQSGNKLLNQRSLANSGLAGDPEHCALASAQAFPGATK